MKNCEPCDYFIEKMYTKTQMVNFAEFLMMKLITKKSSEERMGEIEPYDLFRVNQILNKYKINKKSIKK